MSQTPKSTDTYDYAEINEPQYSCVADYDRFEIEREQLVVDDLLGVGQFGDVFIGKLKNSADGYYKVAIKTCKLECESTMYEKFLEEAYSMKQFNHPHIIQLIGVCSTCPVWIIMELAEFGELRSFLRDNKSTLSTRTLVSYCTQLSMALSYLESKKCVHRDIAARNVLVSSHSCVKLADFGLSRWLDDETYYTASKGKLPIKWMAPESINYRKFTHNTDVWSYGVCMWEILTGGEKPFNGVNNSDVIDRIERGQRLPLPEGCPLSVYALMFDCWAYEPTSRPRFSEIASKLRSLSQDEAKKANNEFTDFTSPHPPNSHHRTSSWELLPPDGACSDPLLPPKPARSMNNLQLGSVSNLNSSHRAATLSGAYSLEKHHSHSNVYVASAQSTHAECVEDRIKRQQQQSMEDTHWLDHCRTDQLSGSGTSLNSQNSCDSPIMKKPPVLARSASLDAVELDREGDVVYEATTSLLREVIAISRQVNQSKHVNIIEYGKCIGTALKKLLEAVDKEISTLPECSREEVSMAHSVLGSDMSRLVKSIRLAVQYRTTALDTDYRREMLREANVLAVDAKHLLDAVDVGRKRLIRDRQGESNTNNVTNNNTSSNSFVNNYR